MAAPAAPAVPNTVDSGVPEPAGANGQSAGNYPESPQSAAENVPAIPATPTVVTSDDAAGGFATNSQSLSDATTPTPTTPVTTTNNNGGSGTGTDTTNTGTSGQPANNSGSGTNGSGSGTDSTTDDNGDVSTGDPLYDSLNAWQDQQDQQAQQAADQQKQDIQSQLQTNLAASDASYAQTVQGLQDSYGSLIDAQTRVNQISKSRSMAYGLASGGAAAAPIEMTNAVTETEQAGMAKIQTLDQQRSADILKAQQAQESGDADLLDKAMTQVDDVETQMKSTLSDVQSQVTSRISEIKSVEATQTKNLATQTTAATAQATLQNGDAFMNATSNAAKDAIIQNIVNSSGGLLDYGTVYASLSTYATAQTKAAQTATADADSEATSKLTQETDKLDQEKDEQDLANGGGTEAERTTATISDIQSGLKPGQTIPGSQGIPVLDSSGNLTPEAWTYMLDNAASNGLTRADLIKNFGSYLVNGAGTISPKFGLTPVETRSITGALPASQ